MSLGRSNHLADKLRLAALASIVVAAGGAGPEVSGLLADRQRRALFGRAGKHRQPRHGPGRALCDPRLGQPADRRHQFGHHKAEYFSAVLEGVLIVIAALLIFREAYDAFISAARARAAAAGHPHQRRWRPCSTPAGRTS